MKRCPQCGRTYSDGLLYCDQDATPLRPARKKLPYYLAGAAVLALAAAGLAVPGFLRQYLQDHVTVEFKDISLHTDPFRWPPLHPYADIALSVRNTGAISPNLLSVRLTCAVAGRDMAALEWPANGEPPLSIAANQETDVKLKLTPRAFDIGSILQQPSSARDAACGGTVGVSLWSIRISRDVSVKTQLW